ncbi:hypothetical protein MAR_027930 [Mya arenaria]|uniref:Double jelly roll-like domain-containing protein n=1 Tax=Mya arenaria TaxID=6604 RepID=A0ABY7DJQ7_MYAAR|nr:hypothetical protein MAR_027930 [Mya arenaria]
MKKNENFVYKNLYAERKAPGTLYQPMASSKPNFAVGDSVRITKKKKTFEKGYTPRWTEEVFTVSEIQYTNPVTYKIKDYNKEEIQVTFYEQELQKTDQEIFRIERVIQKKSKKALVKWLDPDPGAKVTLDKLSWFMPHVLPADAEKFQLYKTIQSKVTLPVGYRMRQCENITVPQSTRFTWRLGVKSSPEKPRWIIVGFQTEKDNDQTKNPAIFDNVNVSNLNVTLNSTSYPAVDYNISFIKQQFSRVYGDAAAFRSKFFHMHELVSNPNITPSDYKDLYPLFVFDVSKQSEKLKTSVTDIQVKAQFNANVPADTQAFALVISDKMLSFQSDGEKMSVIYLGSLPNQKNLGNDLKKMCFRYKMTTKLSVLRQILKDNKIEGYFRCNKPQLIELLEKRGLLPEEVMESELKTIRNNPKHVTLTDVTLDKEYKYPSIYKAALFIKKSPRTITFWNNRVWNKKYLVKVEEGEDKDFVPLRAKSE